MFKGQVTPSFTLAVTKSGSGSGSVTSNPAGINCGATCSASFNQGTSVTLSASPAQGSTFAGWSGGGCSGTGSCTVTMDAAKSVTATFNVQVFTLTVAKGGSGTGSVYSEPSGVACGSTCASSFTQGTVVTLTALPSDTSDFTGWSGACAGTGNCQVTMNGDTAVTATFTVKAAKAVPGVTPPGMALLAGALGGAVWWARRKVGQRT